MINKRTEGKIKSHYGMKDYYSFFNSEYDLNIDKETYNKIINDFNLEVMNLIIEENLDYNLTHLGSTLSIRKIKRKPKIINGKVYNTNPIDWVKTRKMWESDPETKVKKLLVRYLNNHTSGFIFKINFKKYNYSFKNKKYYSFKPSRDFSRLLGKRIKDENKDKFDAYLLY